ncbi:MAG: efflux RND transporter periplasmic adaptor subunit [Rhodospirillaceae bacterium]|jgi:membrane fusion protein, multidrug efflux system|nr:efflux RND transporter periplasmic adaptor subunit [Rhodospirillaceae bacterium]MBT7954998.1 efflux RND transporter periplasmic adaptor subunit [Rhodospirillaceae bacterium]
MAFDKKKILKRLLIIPPILIGVALMAYQVKNRQAPQHETLQEVAKKVRVITVPKLTVVPRALGFGNVTPGTVWEAVAEVAGKIVKIHPLLKAGAILSKDTVILKIDPTDYILARQSIEADIRAINAQISELKTREKNTKASLGIERRSLALNQKDLKRKQALLKRRAVSQAAVDQEERTLLARRQSMQSLQNSLNLLPAEAERLNAQRATLEIKLKNAKLDLARTTITLPFDARIAAVNIELAQFASLGKTLVIGDSIDVSEVSAQLPVDKMARLLDRSRLKNFSVTSATANIEQIMGLKPIVRLRSANLDVSWPGRVVRVSDRLDPRTRTLGVIVAVDNPYKLSIDGNRPPLTKNMYVEVELRGIPQKDKIVLPRSALHNGRVYIAGKNNRLEIKPVKIAYSQGNLTVLASGLKAGERVVVSDLIPAINGMLLSTVDDERVEQSLREAANGEDRL